MAFDLEKYKQITGRLDLDGIDFDDFRDRPLAPEHLRCLRYMHDVEMHTSCYLRNLLNTRAHHDPEVTTFLTMWNFEEYWHGEAIAGVLEAHGEVAGAARVGSMPHEETTHLVDTLFAGPDGRTVSDRIDRRVDLLPGLDGLGLMAGAVDEYGSKTVTLDSARAAVPAPARQRDVVRVDAKAS